MGGKSSVTCLAMVFLTFIGLNGLAPAAQAQRASVLGTPNYQVFAFNDLGMHCYDQDFSVFSLLPPFNVVHGQVVQKGLKPKLLTDAEIKLTYAATPYLSGSKNTTSIGKTNFWSFIAPLFGPGYTTWPLDTGLMGYKMPNIKFGPQPLSYGAAYQDAVYNWFSATGIPLTNIDDRGRINSFSMMNIRAYDKSLGALRSSLDIVVPCSSEMNCASCHETAAFANDVTTFSDASPPPRLPNPPDFSINPDFPIRVRENVLILHDALGNYGEPGSYPGYIAAAYQGYNSLWDVYQAGTPILCAKCHYSKALDLAGTGPDKLQAGHLFLSQAMHKHHGTAWPTDSGGMVGMGAGYTIPIPGAYDPTNVSPQECYYCHPGNDTQCLRSVMAVQGMSCQNCHGDLLAIGGFTSALAMPNGVDPYLPNVSIIDFPDLVVKLGSTGEQRRPWQDMPKCQSCHSGDALNYRFPSIVGQMAYDPNDDAATPFAAITPRFAENPDQLYRFSFTHGGLACESCHGSPHAEWPAKGNTNDNITAVQIQGHTGEIAECGACHTRDLTQGLNGPHDLHSVNDPIWAASSSNWPLSAHGTIYQQDPLKCQACHGGDLTGTVLSKAKANRKLRQSRQTGNGAVIAIAKGSTVDCYSCHNTIH